MTRSNVQPGLARRDAQAFDKLCTSGFLNEAQADMILRAVAVSGQAHFVLSFATAYLAMTARAVPVNAVIEMSETLGARVNLAWSETRWREEHDRLSRRMTLKRLAEADEVYDLSGFEVLLPEEVQGRLVRTSRRLGLEGLRQRHCVASYHEFCRAGRCAIASVILDGARWTVELRLHAGQLRILQVRGRSNAFPSDALLRALRQRFGVEDPVPGDLVQGDPGLVDRSEQGLIRATQPLFTHLRQHGVRRVSIQFDGSGDSGSIGWTAFHPDIGDTLPGLRLERRQRIFENGAWVWVSEPVEQSAKEAIETFVYDFLELTHVDWYNNDGGYGDLNIDLTEDTVECDVNTRFTESHSAYAERFAVATGERLER
jgi:hypothetical protein